MHVTLGLCPRTPKEAAALSGADEPVFTTARRFGVRLRSHPARAGLLGLILLGWCSPPAVSQSADPSFVTTIRSQSNLPPRVAQAHRFLARRGFASGQPVAARVGARANGFRPRPQAAGAQAAWQPLGPTGVLSSNYGLVTGRISSLALDPADGTGNRLYVGTTRGGVWLSQNAGTANPANIVFTPLIDNQGALSTAIDAFHQCWGGHGAARWHRRGPGGHRGPERRTRFLLWSGYSAFYRRRQHMEPDPDHGRPAIRLRRRGLRRICVEHHEPTGGGGGRFAGMGRGVGWR
jgi:hypothetical protein